MLGYGGDYFDVQLSASDVGKVSNLDNTKVVLVRTGYASLAPSFLAPVVLTLLRPLADSRHMVRFLNCRHWRGGPCADFATLTAMNMGQRHVQL